MKTAKHVKQLTGWMGNAACYEMDPPFAHTDWDDHDHAYKYVVISAVRNAFAFETMAFASDADGCVEDFADIAVIRGVTDHEALLNAMGYELEG